MFGGEESAVGEADGGVAEVDDRVVGEGLDVFPFTAVLDLEAAEPVEEDGDAAEVGVRGEPDGVFAFVGKFAG